MEMKAAGQPNDQFLEQGNWGKHQATKQSSDQSWKQASMRQSAWLKQVALKQSPIIRAAKRSSIQANEHRSKKQHANEHQSNQKPSNQASCQRCWGKRHQGKQKGSKRASKEQKTPVHPTVWLDWQAAWQHV
jgi:hypothetical protein